MPENSLSPSLTHNLTLSPPPGGGGAADAAGGGEEEGGDVPLPGDAAGHPVSDGAAQREERQPAAGEHRAGRQAQQALPTVQAPRRGGRGSAPVP